MTIRKTVKPKSPLYIDPTSDFGFHKLFGEEANKDLLIDFLNSMMPAYHQITDLSFKQREQHPDTADERIIIYDIHCKAISGEYFIIEMQKALQKYFANRSIFYGSTAIVKQGRKGKRWQYGLKTVYFIGILDFDYDTDTDRWGKRQFVREFTLKDENGIELSDKLNIRYLQLPFFKKKPHQLKTRFDKWCYFLKNLESLDRIPEIFNDVIFMKALTVTKINKMDPMDYVSYLMGRNAKRDSENAIAYGKELAKQQGRKEGMKEGMKEGREDGLQDGMEKGMEKGIILSIEKSLKKGILTVEQIADTFEVSVAYVLAIKAKMSV